MSKKVRGFLYIFLLLFTGFFFSTHSSAMEVSVDGQVEEWQNVKTQSSNHDAVEKWAIVKDDSYLYFYVQQNGGNQYSMPMADTAIKVTYDSGITDHSSKIFFTYMLREMKDAYYSDVKGAKIAFLPSDQANKYEVEFAVPLSFFTEEAFSISYLGETVSIGDILDCADIELPEATEPVYAGITIDGTFSDWAAVTKTEVNSDGIIQTAAVFEEDFLYLYLKEESNGSATTAGEHSNGKYTICTDLGRHTTFQLHKDSIEGIDGATVSYSNGQYEIAIPASAVKQYQNSISFGLYMNEKMFLEEIYNRSDHISTDKNFSGIVYDGQYADWDYYPHQLIQYSTSGGVGEDAEAALYLDGTTLYGHVLSTLHRNEQEFEPFYLRANEQEDLSMGFRFVTANQDGTVNFSPKIQDLAPGTYEFYLWDLSSGSSATNLNDKDVPIYGQIYLTIREDENGNSISDEVEYYIDLEKFADAFSMDVRDLKILQTKYPKIGSEWVSIAGTSSGAPLGIALGVVCVFAGWLYCKRKGRVV